MRGATIDFLTHNYSRYNFNPRSSCEERHRKNLSRQPSCHFNPRSSCEERLDDFLVEYVGIRAFQSTLLMRGATFQYARVSRHGQRISIHAPHARSDAISWRYKTMSKYISIHAPHARSDLSKVAPSASRSNFNPRSSCEERPGSCMPKAFSTLFQYTLLMRGATSSAASPSSSGKFQSTLLMRGATNIAMYPSRCQNISIHAPHARSDG